MIIVGKNIDRKNVIWNTLGAAFLSFNSLFFTIIVTRINGINDAGIFTYCYATACLLYFIGNYSGRTFQVTDITKKNSDTDYIYNKIITCSIMMLAVITFVLIKQYDIHKSILLIVLCSYKCVEAFAEGIYAIIQKNGNLYQVGISMFSKGIISLLMLLIIDLLTHNLILSSLSIVIVNILFIILYDVKNARKVKIVKTKFTKEASIRLFKIGFFTFILTFLCTYLISAPRYAIDDVLEDNLQTIFGIIIMPATLMGLLAQFIIQPSLTRISDKIKNKNYNELKKIIIILISIIISLGVIVTFVAWLLEVPVLEFIYGVELRPYFTSMMTIIVGSILYALSSILSSLLIAMRRTLGQAIIYGIMAIITTITSYILVRKIEIQGASITYFVTMFILAFAFLIYTIIAMNKYKEQWKIDENNNNNSNI